MSLFKKKEKCGFRGCGNRDIVENLRRYDSNYSSSTLFVCGEHTGAIWEIFEKEFKVFKETDIRLNKYSEFKDKPQSDIGHILWLMDKFPIEDFNITSRDSLWGFEDAIWFKDVRLFYVLNGAFSWKYHTPEVQGFIKIKEKYHKLSAEHEAKIKKDKEAQRQAVLNEMADERIAAAREANENAVKFFGSILTEKGRTLFREGQAINEKLKENKSVRKANKPKAKNAKNSRK